MSNFKCVKILFINDANGITKTISKGPKSPPDYSAERNSDSIFLPPVTNLEADDVINLLNP